MTKFEVATKRKRQVIDITEVCREKLSELKNRSGVCHLFVLHTTAALTIADLDPGTDLDLLDALDALIPKLKYRHPHDPSHVSDHILPRSLEPLSQCRSTTASFSSEHGRELFCSNSTVRVNGR